MNNNENWGHTRLNFWKVILGRSSEERNVNIEYTVTDEMHIQSLSNLKMSSEIIFFNNDFQNKLRMPQLKIRKIKNLVWSMVNTSEICAGIGGSFKEILNSMLLHLLGQTWTTWSSCNLKIRTRWTSQLCCLTLYSLQFTFSHFFACSSTLLSDQNLSKNGHKSINYHM